MPEVAIEEGVGVVVIGRNEGDRLRVCLESARTQCGRLVYVDSGSTDGSIELASELGAVIVELDSTIAFTAARARNAGFDRLIAIDPTVRFVQFIDGDCELNQNWIASALRSFEPEEVVVVCGLRSERYPEQSVYNLLCDMEWDTPIGEAGACGGDALMRVEAFRLAGGYMEDLIAGEEPELCVRLRSAGGIVLRVDEPMTLHDAQILEFGQWWTRAVRAGHAGAEGASRHSDAEGGRNQREVRSVAVWGIALPLLSLLAAAFSNGWSFALFLLYPVQVLRVAQHTPKPNFSTLDQWIYATGCVLGKFPNAQGLLRFRFGKLTGQRSRLIEYKETTDSSAQTPAPRPAKRRGHGWPAE